MGIGYKLKELRKNKKLTQKQLAELVGVSEMSIRRYENDINEPTIEILKRIADKLESPLDSIIAADPNSKLYQATSGINTLKQQAEEEAEQFRENLKVDIAFCTLCKNCGFKIDIETDDDMTFFGDHVVTYKDTNGNLRSFSLTQKQYNHLFKEVCKAITKELILAENYNFLNIGDDD